MSYPAILTCALVAYLSINFILAFALHLHAEHQAHLPHRFMDVAVHFVLLTAFAIPVMLVILAEALFGGEKQSTVNKVAHARAA